jgi:hypothetical protein
LANAPVSTSTTDSYHSYVAVFGTGDANGGNASFSHWTIGSFGNNASLSATAIATTSENYIHSYAAVFGAGYVDGDGTTVSDWTAEFKGNAMIAGTGYHPTASDINIGTLGGDKNENFRFYFNGSDGTVVNIAALKLGAVVNESDTGTEGAKQAALTPVDDQGDNVETDYSRAIASDRISN